MENFEDLMIVLKILLTIAVIVIATIMLYLKKAGRGMGMTIGLIATKAPGFWEQMPKDDDDLAYEALAGITTPYGSGSPRMSRVVRGKVNAYIVAREFGVEVESKEKFRNPCMSAYADGSYPNSIGVYWAIQPVEERS